VAHLKRSARKCVRSPSKILRLTPQWTVLRGLGESSIVKSSVVWFVLTPIVAKLVLTLKFEVLPNTPYASWAKLLVLPFPWWMLYVASLFFAVGTLAFRFYCPPVIRDYANYREFREAGVASFQLTEWFTDIAEGGLSGQTDEGHITNGQALMLDMYCERCFGKKLVDLVDKKTLEEGDFGMISFAIWQGNIPEARIGEAFHMVRKEADHLFPRWALFTTAFFGLGLVATTILLVRNLIYVVQAI